jgi:hypothetical protein
MNIYLSIIKPFSTPKQRMSRSSANWVGPLPRKWKENHDWDPTEQLIYSAGLTFIIDTEDDVYCLFAAERRTENGLVLHPLGGQAKKARNNDTQENEVSENAWDAACRESMEESGESTRGSDNQLSWVYHLTPELCRQVEVSFAVGLSPDFSEYLLFVLEANDAKGEMKKLYLQKEAQDEPQEAKGEIEKFSPQEAKGEIECKKTITYVTNTKCKAKLDPFPTYPYSYHTKTPIVSPTIASFPLYYDFKRFENNVPKPMPVIGSVSADRESREKVTAVPPSKTSKPDKTPGNSPQKGLTAIEFSQQLPPDKAISFHWISLKSLSKNTFQRISKTEWSPKTNEWFEETPKSYDPKTPWKEDDYTEKKEQYEKDKKQYEKDKKQYEKDKKKFKRIKKQFKGKEEEYKRFEKAHKWHHKMIAKPVPMNEISQKEPFYHPQGAPYHYKYKPGEKQKDWQIYYDKFILGLTQLGPDQILKLPDEKDKKMRNKVLQSSPSLIGVPLQNEIKKLLLEDEKKWTLDEITVKGLEMVPGATDHREPGTFVMVAKTITGLEFPLSGLAVRCLCAPGGILDRYGRRFFPPDEEGDSASSNTTPDEKSLDVQETAHSPPNNLDPSQTTTA